MDPATIATSCIGLIAAIAQLSVQIGVFVSDIRDARKDMDAVSRELSSLSLCLQTLRDDSTNAVLPESLRDSLMAIIKNCDLIVEQIKVLLDKMSSGKIGRRVQWATFGREDINRLRSNLESHKSAIDIAIDMCSILLVIDVKADVKDVKADTADIKENTETLLKEIRQLQDQVASLQDTGIGGSTVLERFLEESTNYAETVIDPEDARFSTNKCLSSHQDYETKQFANNSLDGCETENSEVVDKYKSLYQSTGRIIIAVMGMTGVGKTTFISKFTNEPVLIGHTLLSETAKISLHRCSCPSIPEFYLVDTPGFDDTTRSDTDILREIAYFLSTTYSEHVLLTGIIYLHRITDVRMGGAAWRNLRMFKLLCGQESVRRTVLGTTFWDISDQEMATRREEELIATPEFWGSLTEKGSRMFRVNEAPDRIVQYLVDQREHIVLQIQKELVDLGKTLDQTAAGQELQAEMGRNKQHLLKEQQNLEEELSELVREAGDANLQEAIERERKEIEERVRRIDLERQKLHTDLRQLQAKERGLSGE